MEKLLTISVAAYNGANTLRRALDSCIVPGNELYEVWIIDDGSRDETPTIAETYISRFPAVFRLLRKENGGYGSTIECSLQRAQGKYFRTLDCDDWFEPGSLEKFLRFLTGCDADTVYTDYKTVQSEGPSRFYHVYDGIDAGRQYTFASLPRSDLCMEMHSMTFKTQALRRAQIELPHHCSYTDMLYTFLGLRGSETLSFCPILLYCYQLGRDGQSVSLESYRKHFDEYEKVTFLIAKYAQALAGDSNKNDILIRRARDVAQNGIEICLRQPHSSAMRKTLREYDRRLRREFPDIAKQMQNKNTRLLRASRYGLYPLLGWWARRKAHIQA